MNYIQTQIELEKFIASVSKADAVALDTEFLREKTYFPKLCLLQIATKDKAAIIDPLNNLNLSSVADLLTNKKIVKVFHAPMQDIEILLRETGTFPEPLFDTQTAALFLGYNAQVSYATLVQSRFSISLKKADSFSDWSLRPLSDSQISYALHDVTYLIKLYYDMKEELNKLERMDWFINEQSQLFYPNRFEIKSEERFFHLKRVNQLQGIQLALAKDLCTWREETAIKKNIPRKWVISDEQILDISKKEITTIDELLRVRGIHERLSISSVRELSKILQKSLKTPYSEWPHLDNIVRNENNVDIELCLMSALVQKNAKLYSLAASVLAPHEELVRLARGYQHDNLLLSGWRKELIGKELLELLNGRISLSLNKGYLNKIPLQ